MHARPSERVVGHLADRARVVPDAGRCTTSSRASRSRSSSSPRTPRTRASRASRRCWRATASSRASSSTSATGSSTRTASSSSPGSRRALIWIFKANVTSLIHLYVVGVFTAFTLSQAGMVRYWRRTRERGWRRRAVVNGVGAVRDRPRGADRHRDEVHRRRVGGHRRDPAAGRGLLRTHRHYRRVGRRLRAGVERRRGGAASDEPVVLYVDRSTPLCMRRLVRATHRGRRFPRGPRARAAAPTRDCVPRFRELTDMRPDLEVLARGRARRGGDRVPVGASSGRVEFVTVSCPSSSTPLARLGAAHGDGVHAQARLLASRAWRDGRARARAGRPGPPQRAVAGSSSPAGTLRRCARCTTPRTLGFADTKAVFFAFDAEEARGLQRVARAGDAMPLEVEEAPFRDIGEPILRHLRAITADPEAVAVVVMPELDFPRLAAAAAQPARALHEAPAPLRAARDPRHRAVPDELAGPVNSTSSSRWSSS